MKIIQFLKTTNSSCGPLALDTSSIILRWVGLVIFAMSLTSQVMAVSEPTTQAILVPGTEVDGVYAIGRGHSRALEAEFQLRFHILPFSRTLEGISEFQGVDYRKKFTNILHKKFKWWKNSNGEIGRCFMDGVETPIVVVPAADGENENGFEKRTPRLIFCRGLLKELQVRSLLGVSNLELNGYLAHATVVAITYFFGLQNKVNDAHAFSKRVICEEENSPEEVFGNYCQKESGPLSMPKLFNSNLNRLWGD